MKTEPPIDIRWSRNQGSENERSKKFERLPRWNWTPERVAAAEEVARVELELPEEAVELRVARAELDLVAVRVRPLDRDVDGLLLRVDAEVRVLLDLEVAELRDLEEALPEDLHVHDVALEDAAARGAAPCRASSCCPVNSIRPSRYWSPSVIFTSTSTTWFGFSVYSGFMKT